MPFIAGNKTVLKISGTATQLTNEAMTEVSGTVFQITDAAKRVLSTDGTFTVDVDASPEPSANYTIDYLFGTVTFDSSQTGSTVDISSADADGYLTMSPWANGRQVSLSLERVDLDSTVFGDDARGRTAGTADVNGSIELLDDANTDIYGTTDAEDILQAGTALVLELDLAGDGSDLIRAWVRIQTDEVSVNVNELVGETVNLVAAKQIAAMSDQEADLWSHNFS